MKRSAKADRLLRYQRWARWWLVYFILVTIAYVGVAVIWWILQHHYEGSTRRLRHDVRLKTVRLLDQMGID